MTWTQGLLCLWTLLITQTACARAAIQFVQRGEGRSVVLPCELERGQPAPYGLYLRRGWLQPGDVLFKHTGSDFHVDGGVNRSRITVSGEPSGGAVNVTLSRLSAADTDRYHCDFVVANPVSEDERRRGTTEFFLLVDADAPGWVDVAVLEVCAGGSAVLPCLPPPGEAVAAADGVSVRRRRGQGPVEELYHSQHHRSTSSSSSSGLSIQLAPGPPGRAPSSVTLGRLRPEDSAMYGCVLLPQGRPDGGAGLGRGALFVSVEGCGCSSYPAVLYTLSSAVAVLLLLLLLVFLALYKGKARRSVKPHSQAPIYEEMVGMQPPALKVASQHLEEAEPSVYRNCSEKRSCPENHYESPRGGLCPRRGSLK